MNDNLKISYIVGIGRSGTTLLSNQLNQHRELHCTPESVFLVFFLNKFKNKNITKQDVSLIVSQIDIYGLSHPWVGWIFDKEKVFSDFDYALQKNAIVSYNEIVKIIYQNFKINQKENDKFKYIIDKNPSYSLYVDKLQDFSPDAKFIMVFRDYRANVLSRKQSVYLKSPNVAYNAYRWRLFNKKLLKFYQLNSKKCFFLKYEDYINQNEIYLNKIYSFLDVNEKNIETNINFEAELDPESVPEKHRERYIKKYADLNKKIYNSRVDSWREKLTEKEIIICDVFCSSVGQKLGYKTENKFNTFQKIYYHCRYIYPISKARLEVYKDYLIFYMPLSLKIKKLIQRHKKNGFIE